MTQQDIYSALESPEDRPAYYSCLYCCRDVVNAILAFMLMSILPVGLGLLENSIGNDFWEPVLAFYFIEYALLWCFYVISEGCAESKK